MRLTCMLMALASTLAAQGVRYDLVIAHGRIHDGTGNPWFVGDVAIVGDTIAAIGKLPPHTAGRTIDARGLAVSPGFVDTHSHGRRGIFAVPTAENVTRQGVTTLIEGPDGGSPLPLKPFLDKLRATPIAVNFGTMVGHGTVRGAVMGSQNRKATEAELQKMREIVRQAMLEGAFGLSTGLFYVPGNYAPTEEVIELEKVVSGFGGVHTSHVRNEAEGVLDSARETIRIGEEGGVPTQHTHVKVVGKQQWGGARRCWRCLTRRGGGAWTQRWTSIPTRRRRPERRRCFRSGRWRVGRRRCGRGWPRRRRGPRSRRRLWMCCATAAGRAMRRTW
ncbi:MAG: amidohydrolase family protein [Bryobacterales bacterium]|nr:amidohydrolase family protein [Bryobacterales bacterium]